MQTLIRIGSYSTYDIPQDYKGLSEFIESAVNKAPKKYKNDVQFEFETIDDYGSYYTQLDIYYYREETAKEKSIKILEK